MIYPIWKITASFTEAKVNDPSHGSRLTDSAKDWHSWKTSSSQLGVVGQIVVFMVRVLLVCVRKPSTHARKCPLCSDSKISTVRHRQTTMKMRRDQGLAPNIGILIPITRLNA